MNAFGISLGFLLALTLVYALEKDIPSAANDTQPGNAAHAQEDGIKDAVNATWPFHAFVRRHPVKSANERRNDGDAKDGVRGEKIHRRSRRDDDFEERRKKAKTVVLFILIAPFLLMCLGLGVGVGMCIFCKERRKSQGMQGGRAIQPARPSAYPAQPVARPNAQPSAYPAQPVASPNPQPSAYPAQPVARPNPY